MNRIKSFSDLNTRTIAKSKQTLLRFFNSKYGTKNIKEIKKNLVLIMMQISPMKYYDVPITDFITKRNSLILKN